MVEGPSSTTRAVLEELLDRVLPHIQVTILDNVIALSEYRDVLQQARVSNDAHDKARVNSYEVKIQDQNLADEIRDFIQQELRDYIQDNRVRTAVARVSGVSHMTFGVDALVERLLDLSIIMGAEDATNSFACALEVDSCPYRKLTLVGAVTLEEEIHLYDGIRLLPLPDTDESLLSTYPNLLPDSELRHRFREAVLIEEERTVSPQFMRPDDDSRFVTESASQQANDFDPRMFCLILSLVTRRHAYVSMEWASMSEDEFINMLSGSAFKYIVVQSPELTLPVSTDEIAEARTAYDSFKSTPIETQRRLDIPLTRLAASTNNNKGIFDRIVDLAIALESLYLADEDRELSFRLRLRASKHLEDTLEARKPIRKTLGRFYDLRSRIVHTGTIPTTELTELIKLIASTQEVCRRSIRKILEQGQEPDWSDIDYS